MSKKMIITKEIREQILSVRDTGKTNMFIIPCVHKLAFDMELFDLAVFLGDRKNHKAYCEFILHGDKKAQ